MTKEHWKIFIAHARVMDRLERNIAKNARQGVLTEAQAQPLLDACQHHEERLERMRNLAKTGKTAYETATEVFRDKALTAHQWRFAMAETIAHLDYLAAEGKLAKEQRGGITVYSEGSAREGVSP